MERRHILHEQPLAGYDALKRSIAHVALGAPPLAFSPNQAYDAYHRIHKVFVRSSGADDLITIACRLKNETMPRYLEAGGWASAEAALAADHLSSLSRLALLDDAEEMWSRALAIQQTIESDEDRSWLHEASAPYRMALDIANIPLMKALVAGNVTEKIREQTFVDTLMLAQAADIRQALAQKAGDIETSADLIGFGHECTALLALLYLDDPRYLPLPSSARAGAGYDYPNQTHDITVLNQHFGDILKVIPVEVKAKASLRDLTRYDSLIVRGKMHLSYPGKYLPRFTHEAFAASYDGAPTKEQVQTIDNATKTFCDLLKQYQKGERRHRRAMDTRTRFYETDALVERYKEFSVERSSM